MLMIITAALTLFQTEPDAEAALAELPPERAEAVTRILEGVDEPDAELFLRWRLGDEGETAMWRALQAGHQARIAEWFDNGESCLGPREQHLHRTRALAALGETRDEQAARADRVRSHIQELTDDIDRIETLESEEPTAWSIYRDAARDAETDELAELFLRTARDQYARISGFDTSSLENEDEILAARQITAWSLLCPIDVSNTQWLKDRLREHGWFTISEHGERAANAAWLLAQHADRDRAFQREVLAAIEPLAAEGEVEPSSYAYLHDRVAVGEGRAQRFGTQGRCADGAWAPLDLEDPERVDERREDYGLGPLADYVAGFNDRGACEGEPG